MTPQPSQSVPAMVKTVSEPKKVESTARNHYRDMGGWPNTSLRAFHVLNYAGENYYYDMLDKHIFTSISCA
jgi:hypothetical protein